MNVASRTVHLLALSSYLTRSWDFGRMKKKSSELVASIWTSVASREQMSPQVDMGVARVALIGAMLVIGERAKNFFTRAFPPETEV